MVPFSFRKYVLMREDHQDRFAGVADKAVELARSIRDPESDNYIPDDSARELVTYCLEEVQRFLNREMKTGDPDEGLLKIKEFRRKVFDEINKADEEAHHSMDLGQIEDMIDKLIADAVKVVTG